MSLDKWQYSPGGISSSIGINVDVDVQTHGGLSERIPVASLLKDTSGQ